jgi:cell fate (sporulation/competence/biofilm development) regulator YlbF (YheA/YmcA/DUF963 family)
MDPTLPGGVTEVDEGTAAALDAARALARALGSTPEFRHFETADAAFRADDAARRRLEAFQSRRQELAMAAMWGGADRAQQEELQREWERIAAIPTLRDHMAAQDGMAALFREVTAKITAAVGMDYGAACAPGGGCCG